MDRKVKVMIVDDDKNIAELIDVYLKKEGYETKKFYNGKEALKEFERFAPDLVILDIMLTEIDGYEICREIRKISNIPIIMLTAKGETFDKVLGLELGADDYIVKPFDAKELLARIKAVLRRYNSKHSDNVKLVIPNLTIDISDYSIIYHGKKMEIPPKELELLYFLASNANRVFTREQLLDKIWGYDYAGGTRTVDVHIKRLREKFNLEDSWEIKTVWGVGYKFQL
ncbi:DNA-binding response regulator, OmpR family, contains REC and winged-helix (wHTH) domain [Caminicella sporogenes DSM 14501]|uniref:Stage 0 sporulation protein A homolog n=1 Tax=Caminicella sporogenes DSM 14501 TaxID=1121266 RepID=A0A1M6NLB6_9FIRM|nr:response regulator transcription factor [Caminicella sporogenes]RKD22162.1 DNA-binding response regulator [Caminicella sporogenes]SHJ96523.1 DNA-binding response regulator, OmpR family, contains REC and winged-helix (wHTH) domain [Caminicella sporogenes DSM 14501]